MSIADLVIREEARADRGAVASLLCSAFGSGGEATLVQQLGRQGAGVLSLVAAANEEIVGYALFSRLEVATETAMAAALALAPLAVAPAWQRRGIGSRLVREGHRRLAARGETLVFVLGDPAYYQRFGFSADAARDFRTPFDGPHMMALALAPGAPRRGTVRYPAPFGCAA
jgi:putative acetyltransferase